MRTLYTFAFLFLSLTAFSQSPIVTTDVEYNWCVNLFKNVELGGDIKNGYSIVDMGQPVKIDTYEFIYKAFVRDGKQPDKKDSQIACIIIVATSTSWGNKYYFCLPFNNQSLTEKYFQSITVWDKGMSNAFAKINSVMFAQSFAAAAECESKN